MIVSEKASDRLKSLLNWAMAGEIQVSIQYMRQHTQTVGPIHALLSSKFEEVAVQEMGHAEAIAERLPYLGCTSTTNPDPTKVGSDLRTLEQDARDGENAITLYKQVIGVTREEGDITTTELFKKILKDEEHHDFFLTVLERLWSFEGSNAYNKVFSIETFF